METQRKATKAAPNTEYKGTENLAVTQANYTNILAGVRKELGNTTDTITEAINNDTFIQTTDTSVVSPVEYIYAIDGVGFIEENRINCVTSIGRGNKTGGGKSTLQKILAAAYVGGGVGCLEASEKGMCIYIDAEMGDSRTMEFRRQVRLILEHAGKTYDESKLITYTFNPEATADCDKRLEAVLSIMDEEKPSLLIFDPFTYLVSDDGQGDTPIQERLAELKRHAAKNGTTVIIVAHGTKSSEDSNLSGRTGTLLQQDCSFLLGVEHVKQGNEDYFRVIPLKSRGVPFKEFHFSFIGEKGSQYPFPYIAQDSTDNMPFTLLFEYMKKTFGEDEELKAAEIDSRLAEIAGKANRWARDVKAKAKAAGILTIARIDGRNVIYTLKTE